MSQIIKAFTGVFIALFLMATGTGVLGGALQIMQAQDFHGKVIDELENSDYALPVLKNAFLLADEMGGQLELLLYLKNGDSIVCVSSMDFPDSIGEVEMAEVLYWYPIRMPFMGFHKELQLIGYAR